MMMMMMKNKMKMNERKIMLDLGILTSGTTPNLDISPLYSLIFMIPWGLLGLMRTTTATNMQDKHMDDSHPMDDIYVKSMVSIELGLTTVQSGNPNKWVELLNRSLECIKCD